MARARIRTGIGAGRGLVADRRGTAAIEFALVAAPLLAMLIAILQTSILFFAGQALQTVAEQAQRQLMTGSAQRAAMTQTEYRDFVCGKLPTLFSCSKLMIDVRTASSFAAASSTTPSFTYDGTGNISNDWQYQPGSPGDILVMKIMYPFPVVGGPLGFSLANINGGSRLLISTAVFKTEPY